jgi:hypothetical protein
MVRAVGEAAKTMGLISETLEILAIQSFPILPQMVITVAASAAAKPKRRNVSPNETTALVNRPMHSIRHVQNAPFPTMKNGLSLSKICSTGKMPIFLLKPSIPL